MRGNIRAYSSDTRIKEQDQRLSSCWQKGRSKCRMSFLSAYRLNAGKPPAECKRRYPHPHTVLFHHFIGNSLFRLVRFGSLCNFIQRHFTLTLAKFHFYVDMTIRFFVGEKYARLKTSIAIFIPYICLFVF